MHPESLLPLTADVTITLEEDEERVIGRDELRDWRSSEMGTEYAPEKEGGGSKEAAGPPPGSKETGGIPKEA
ncbi:MAG: hypothetical protein KJ621_06740, partial [Proteobacteria bacterium]|nr:hypothetical protein [Pseudomonadota bacterium]